MEKLCQNKLIYDYLSHFDRDQWEEVVETLVELAIKNINDEKKKENSPPEARQKFTVKKIENKNPLHTNEKNELKTSMNTINASSNKKDKLFTVSIDKINRESQNKNEKMLFSLDNKFERLSKQLSCLDNNKKNKKFNVEYHYK